MIRQFVYRRNFLMLFVASLVAIVGCNDGSWAKQLEYGVTVPNARFEVTLPAKVNKYDLYLAFEKAAKAAGYTHRVGRPLSKNYLEVNDLSEFFQWESKLGSPHYPHSLNFITPLRMDYPDSFTVMYEKVTTERFSAAEWLQFYELYEEFLPAAFPDAAFEITRHPALFTRQSELLSISEETGIAIPDKIMKKFEKWLAEQK